MALVANLGKSSTHNSFFEKIDLALSRTIVDLIEGYQHGLSHEIGGCAVGEHEGSYSCSEWVKLMTIEGGTLGFLLGLAQEGRGFFYCNTHNDYHIAENRAEGPLAALAAFEKEDLGTQIGILSEGLYHGFQNSVRHLPSGIKRGFEYFVSHYSNGLSRRDFLKLSGTAAAAMALPMPSDDECGEKTQTPSADGMTFDSDLFYDPLEIAESKLTNDYVQASVELNRARARALALQGAGDPSAATYTLAFSDRVSRLENEIRSYLSQSINLGLISSPTDNFFENVFQKYTAVANELYRTEVELMMPIYLKIGGRMILSLTPADIVFDAVDVYRGENEGVDMMGFPVTKLDKVLNAGSLTLGLASAGASIAIPVLDGAEDVNDALRGFRYLANVAADGSNEIYIARLAAGGQSIEYVKFGSNAGEVTETLVKAEDMSAIVQQVAREASATGKLIVDIGTGKNVARFGQVGDLYKEGGYSVLAIEANAPTWNKITSNVTESQAFITNVNGVRVVGYEGYAMDLSKLVNEAGASGLRLTCPSNGLIGLAMNADQIAAVVNSGKKVQMTLNMSPLLKTVFFKLMPDNLVTRLYNLEGVSDYINQAAKATEGSSDAAKYPISVYESGAAIERQREILGQFIGATSRTVISGSVQNPLHDIFVNFIYHNNGATVNQIAEYFNTMLDGKAATSYKNIRLVTEAERKAQGTFFSAIESSGSHCMLPQLLVEYTP